MVIFTEISQRVNELLDYYRKLDVLGKQLLASSLILGLITGGAIPLLYCNNLNSRNMEKIDEIQGDLEREQEANLILQTAVEDCAEETRALIEKLEDMRNTIDARESEISVLEDTVSEYGSYHQVYIKDATLDYVNELIHLTISNPTDYNNVATRIAALSGLEAYHDESEDATGYLYSNSETRLTWDRRKASAHNDFLREDKVYMIMMTTITNYTCLHQIFPVDVKISVDEWDIIHDRVFLKGEISGGEYGFYPTISSIGLRKIGSDDELYYNASYCLIDDWYEGGLYSGLYNWNESAASAPSGFLSAGDAYLARITYAPPSEHLQTTAAIRYSYTRKYTLTRIDTVENVREKSLG